MEHERLREHVDTIREVFSYLRQFQGRTFVVRIDFTVLDDPLFSVLVKDLSLLHQAGIRIAIVPSARERIDEVLATYGVPYEVHGGIRVTSEEAMPFIKMAAFDVSNRVMTMLSASGITAVIGNWVRARGIGVIDGVDYKSAGVVESVRADTLRTLMEGGVVPIFPCIGWSSVGQPYNISSNELAVVVATTLGAGKLFFLTTTPAYTAASFRVPETVPVAPGGRLANFSLAGLDEFFAANPGREADLELLHRARRACAAGVERVHILDGRDEGGILREIFSNLGSGTMVYSNRYGGIRPMRLNDVSDVLRIMQPFVERGILLPRSEAQLKELARRLHRVRGGRLGARLRRAAHVPRRHGRDRRHRRGRALPAPRRRTQAGRLSLRAGLAGRPRPRVRPHDADRGLVPEAGLRGSRPLRAARQETPGVRPAAQVAHLHQAHEGRGGARGAPGTVTALRWIRRGAAVLLLVALFLPLSRCSHSRDDAVDPGAPRQYTYSYAWTDFDASSAGSWLIFLAFLWPVAFVARELAPARQTPAWLAAVQLALAAGAALLIYYRTFLDELWVGGYLAYIALGCYSAALIVEIGVRIAHKLARKKSGP